MEGEMVIRYFFNFRILANTILTMLTSHLKLFLVLLLFGNTVFSQQRIDTSEAILIGGIKQYVRIKGKDHSKPILLFLHGGPGGSLMGKMDKISGKLQQHFIVVQWDQRETGETLKLNKSKKPLTLDMFYSDTHELIIALLKKFQQPKLYLAGYSWGSGMGFYIAEKYPELLYAYIAISPVIDTRRSDSISLAMLKETMGKRAEKDLAQVKIPFENADQLYYHRKWLFKHDGQGNIPKSFVQSWSATWFDVWSRSCEVNRFESLPSINCPVYFFAGERDYNTNSSITKEYADKVSAPRKDMFLFKGVGHSLPETHPDWFQQVIIEKILPQTFVSD